MFAAKPETDFLPNGYADIRTTAAAFIYICDIRVRIPSRATKYLCGRPPDHEEGGSRKVTPLGYNPAQKVVPGQGVIRPNRFQFVGPKQDVPS
jgi:hypothetical protein